MIRKGNLLLFVFASVMFFTHMSIFAGGGIFELIGKGSGPVDLQKVKKIIEEKNIDVNQVNSLGETILFLACKRFCTDELKYKLVEYLIKKGADKSINNVTNNGSTPLLAVCSKLDFKTMKLLIENGAKKYINKIDSYGRTPLHYACYGHNLDMVKYLIKNGAIKSINKFTSSGNTPILICSYSYCETEMFFYLITCGANLNIINND
ncbi:ankyrin repeat domain-containing protein, partial [Candidatus Dependentiae bacterium]